MIDIQFADDRSQYVAGETLKGRVLWQLEEAPQQAELHLLWYTEGKGTQDVEVVKSQQLESSIGGDKSFSFELPPSPYSFAGELISLLWAVEAVIGNESNRRNFQMTSDGREVRLPPTPQ